MKIELPKDFHEYVVNCRARLLKGAEEYGMVSFSEDPMKLLSEIQEELMDVCNWSFILWTRLKAIEQAMMNSKEVDFEIDLG